MLYLMSYGAYLVTCISMYMAEDPRLQLEVIVSRDHLIPLSPKILWEAESWVYYVGTQ